MINVTVPSWHSHGFVTTAAPRVNQNPTLCATRDKPERQQELVDKDYETTTYIELKIAFGGWLWKSEDCNRVLIATWISTRSQPSWCWWIQLYSPTSRCTTTLNRSHIIRSCVQYGSTRTFRYICLLFMNEKIKIFIYLLSNFRDDNQ